MIFNKILEFNTKLNDFHYGIPTKNGLMLDYEQRDYEKYMVTFDHKQFEKYKGGVCWDYVMYETYYFKKYFPNVKFSTYYNVGIDVDSDLPTHTFLLYYMNEFTYWFESSWKIYRGVRQFYSESDAINYICGLLKLTAESAWIDQYVIKYDALNPSLIGVTCNQYMYKFKPMMVAKNKIYPSKIKYEPELI